MSFRNESVRVPCMPDLWGLKGHYSGRAVSINGNCKEGKVKHRAAATTQAQNIEEKKEISSINLISTSFWPGPAENQSRDAAPKEAMI